MSRLNKPTPPPKFEDDPYKMAEELMDKLFPLFHDYEPLNVHSSITKSDLLDNEKTVASHLRDKIDDLLYNKFEYVEKSAATESGYYGYLSQKGREVKKAGGHFKYMEKLDAEKEIARDKDKYELEVKKWTYKSRYVPYILSFIALLISTLTYFNNLSKEATNKELKNKQTVLENTIDSITQELKNVITLNDSLIKKTHSTFQPLEKTK